LRNDNPHNNVVKREIPVEVETPIDAQDTNSITVQEFYKHKSKAKYFFTKGNYMEAIKYYKLANKVFYEYQGDQKSLF
jgi:hypothetical protein